MHLRNADQLNTKTEPPIILIGSGAVGLYAAAQLTRRGNRVLVIEAGGTDLGRFAPDSYISIGREHTGIRIGRARTLGGTTNLWGGQLVEFQPIDFEGRRWMPGSDWPLRYAEVAQYYPLTYQNLGMPERMLRDDLVWKGISCNRPEISPDFEVFLTRWMRTPNVAELFASQVQSDEHLSVLTGHTAVALRGTGSRLTAVRVVDEKGQSNWIEGETFLLAAGTIENSRLLLHTAQNSDWEAPWRDNDNVGRYFQDHLAGRIGSMHPADKRRFFKMFCNVVYGGYKFQPKIRMANAVLEREKIYNTQAFFSFESEISEHLVYLKQFLKAALYGRKPVNVGETLRKGLGTAGYLLPLMWKYIWDHRVFVPGSAKINLLIQAEHAPRADSRILINKDRVDSFGLPQVVLDWRLGGDELRSLRSFALRIREALQSSGTGEVRIDEDLLVLNPNFLNKLGDIYHQSGGTIMANSPQDGVVDKNLRVFGTDNLYVLGASVFRTTSNANVTFTALALTTRLVDHLTGAAPASSDAQLLAGRENSR